MLWDNHKLCFSSVSRQKHTQSSTLSCFITLTQQHRRRRPRDVDARTHVGSLLSSSLLPSSWWCVSLTGVSANRCGTWLCIFGRLPLTVGDVTPVVATSPFIGGATLSSKSVRERVASRPSRTGSLPEVWCTVDSCGIWWQKRELQVLNKAIEWCHVLTNMVTLCINSTGTPSTNESGDVMYLPARWRHVLAMAHGDVMYYSPAWWPPWRGSRRGSAASSGSQPRRCRRSDTPDWRRTSAENLSP